jgi:Fe-S-cluster containining protein
MTTSLTDRLCTHCALCCDGSLFADVELVGEKEAIRLEGMGLEVDDSDAEGALLVLPCRALEGKRCGIYAHRPSCCRTFECGLLQNVRRGAVGVEQAERHIADALARIGHVKRLLAELGRRDTSLPLKERVAEALADESAAGIAALKRRAELEAAMSAVESLISSKFLGRGRARRGGRGSVAG